MASGLVWFRCCGSSPSAWGVNVSPNGARRRGLWEPRLDIPVYPIDCLCFSLSSVALSRASRASSSEVWCKTAFFLDAVSLVSCCTCRLSSLLLVHSSVEISQAVVNFEYIV